MAPAATGPPESTAPAAASAPTVGNAAPSAAARSVNPHSDRPMTSTAPTPARSGIAKTKYSHSEPAPGCGTACSSGSPGSGPWVDPRTETELPAPTAKPGPAA